MPVQYSGILDEHKAVRERVGLFDVSHMGEIEVDGPEALALVNYVTTNDAAKLKDGQAQYSALLYHHGGFVDDILVHRVREDHLGYVHLTAELLEFCCQFAVFIERHASVIT